MTTTKHPARRVWRPAAAGLALAMAAVGLTAAGGPAGAAAGDIIITGRGYGHGIGMSQYGAKGRAEAGQTYAQILAAYYPGTTLTSGSDVTPITVWLQEDTDSQTWVVAEAGLTVQGTDPATDVTHDAVALPATVPGPGGQVAPTAWRLRLNSQTLVLEGYYSGTWYDHGVPAITETLAGVNRGTFAAADGTVRLITGSTYREHRGVLSANRVSSGVVRTTVTLPMGEYLKSVVKAEMPASWAAAAVQAQSVAARTYASYDRDVASRPWWYDTCNTTSCQVYRGVADYTGAGVRTTEFHHELATAAVGATAGKYLAYGGKPAFTQFSASNGGYSLAGSQPYLVAAADPYDAYPEWSVTVTKSQIEGKYPAIGIFTGMSASRDGKGAYGGRVVEVQITGTSGTVTVTGSAFRSAFGLKSTMWSAARVGLPPKPRLVTPQRDWSGDTVPDLIARAPDGKLFLYAGRGPGQWSTRRQIGNGWQVMGLMTQVYNLSGSRVPEILTTDPSTGSLRLYPGNGAGGFGRPRVVGWGWQGFSMLIGVHGWHAANASGLLARDAAGRLILYPGNGAGGFGRSRVVGTNWNIMDVISFGGDLTGDGRPDIVAREEASGSLFVYPGTGTGAFGRRIQVAGEWSQYDVILAGADWNWDGRIDVIAREAATGNLFLYPGTGTGALLAPEQVGYGWTGFTIIG